MAGGLHYTARMARTIDLHFQGCPGVIATAVLPCEGGVLLVDPGPSSCLPALEGGLAGLGLGWPDVRGLLLTHIHLDHAGASGTLARRLPGLPVYVHELGAWHLGKPEKLLASATRLYGADMDRLWGEFAAVPTDALRPLSGDETLAIGGRILDVAYTPGHASHHVAYHDRAERTVYVGDTCGVRVAGLGPMPATPPPDVDPAKWEESLQAIEAWGPLRLFLTHFGPVDDAPAVLARFRRDLRDAVARARDLIRRGGDDAELERAWSDDLRRVVRAAGLTGEARHAVELAAPFEQGWQGLARYWRKRVERDGAGVLEAPPD